MPQQATNIFGGPPAQASTVTSPAVSSGNPFGTPSAAKPLQNMFGGASSPQQNSFAASPFGGANTTPTTNLFGGASATSSEFFFCLRIIVTIG